jgi:hypothetical protein
MIVGLFALALLLWLPVFIYGIERHGFKILLVWLLISPVVINIITKPGENPLFSPEKPVKALSGPNKLEGYLKDTEGTVKIKELVDPNRLIFGIFFVTFVLEALLKKRRLGPFDKTEKFAAVFTILLVASAILASRRTAYSLRIACDAFIVPFIAYFCARRLVMNEQQVVKLVRVLTYLGVALIGIGLVERVVTSGLFTRVEGPFDGRDELFIVLVVIFFTVAVDWIQTRHLPNDQKLLTPVLQKIVLALTPLIIMLGWGRGNMLAFFSGIWVFAFFGRKLLAFRSKIAVAGLLFLMVPILALALYELTPDEIVEARIRRESTVYSRLGAWQNIAEEFSKAPVFGIGLNNLRDVLHVTRTYVEGVKSETHAHNSPLSIGAELGVAGFLVFAALAGSILLSGLNLYRKGPDVRARWRGIAVMAVVCSYFVGSIFANTLYIPAVSHVYVYLLVGGIVGLYGRQRAVAALPHARNSSWIPAKISAQVRFP